VSKHIIKTLAGIGLLSLTLSLVGSAQEAKRTAKERRTPVYPELAKKMNISGTVKVEVIVAPTGAVKSAKALGGHPLLIDAAVNAAKQFKYESASADTTEMISFNFNTNN
jgi:TonB family protein